MKASVQPEIYLLELHMQFPIIHDQWALKNDASNGSHHIWQTIFFHDIRFW